MESSGVEERDSSVQLRQVESVHSRADRLEPAREYWQFMLWAAVLASIYAAVFLVAFAGQAADPVSSEHGGNAMATMLAAPVLVFSSLSNGARERFQMRRRPSAVFWVVGGLLITGFAAMAALSLTGIGYPWWINALFPLALFISMAVNPLRGLARTSPRTGTSWSAGPLSRPVRITTLLIGLSLGAMLAVSTHWLGAVFTMVFFMAFLVLMLSSWNTRYGLPRAGYEWGRWHWAGFGASTATMFSATLMISLTDQFAALYGVLGGVVIALIMSVLALPPRAAQSREGQ